ncbi:polysaccharide biosynthesis C-terminal domain-containing protein [Lysobacter korlensis]|uniref:Polysaccharide biosynthesis C-terminal domain-containing protein n=1 Tax=Lysobacter korlensis TaxID=553636 RepID=A0ABV6RZP7_9GAMM
MDGERLVRSGTISLAGSAVAALSALVLTALVGNGLGAHGTGVFFQALGIFTIATQVLKLGTNSGIIRSVSEQRAFSRSGETWVTVLVAIVPVVVLSTAAAVLLAVFADPVAGWLAAPGERADLAALLRLMAPFLVLAALLSVLQTVSRMVRGVLTFTMLQSILLPLSRLALVGVGVLLAWDAFGAFTAWMAAAPFWLVVTAGLLVQPLVRDWGARAGASEPVAAAARRFWSFSAARAVGGSLETALEWADVLIVAALRSPAEAGIYAVATRTVRAGQIVDRAMRIAVSPTISRLLARSEVAAARDLHTSVTRGMILATWPYYLLLATMGPAVLFIFGGEFTDGAVVLLILSGAMMLSAAAGMLQSILLQGGRSTWQMYNKAIALAVNVTLNLLLVPVLGIAGAAITWTVGILLDTAIAAWQVHRKMGVSLQPRRLLTAMAVPLVVFGVGGLALRLTFGTSIVAFGAGLLVLGAVYVAGLWLFRRPLGLESLWSAMRKGGPKSAKRVEPEQPVQPELTSVT